ncbi:MAG: hypothetical protein ACI8X5_003160 [Planctomycetota bacterium]
MISFPWRLRYLLALDSRLCRAVRKLFLRAVFALYSKKAQLDSAIQSHNTEPGPMLLILNNKVPGSVLCVELAGES